MVASISPYIIAVLAASFSFGVSSALAVAVHLKSRNRITRLHHALGILSSKQNQYQQQSFSWLIKVIENKSVVTTGQQSAHHVQANPSDEKTHTLIVQAGLREKATQAGLRATQRTCALGACAVGAIVGACFTPALSIVACIGGLAAGIITPKRVLKNLANARKQNLERGLSQTLEVICLGLRAGLSFDRALSLYCKSFTNPFAIELEQSMHLWQAGIRTREQALRSLAETYDSPIFGRVVDNIVRSLRFGSPLADSLEVLATEARQAHQAVVQEAVMKAPVKMMVPVGVLILPSMLILVLGPVLLDLMNGF